MTRLILNPTPDGATNIEVITENGDKHGEIADAAGVARFNIGPMDIEAMPAVAGIVLWTAPNSSHPTPDALDTTNDEFLGPISTIPVGSGSFNELGDDILPIDPRYHEERGPPIEVDGQ